MIWLAPKVLLLFLLFSHGRAQSATITQGPDLTTSRPSLPTFTNWDEIQQCTRSWKSYSSIIEDPKYRSTVYTISRTTKLFETLESFGKNQTYTECDGVPRLRFLASPTATVTRTVTQIGITSVAVNTITKENWSVSPPTCRISPDYCLYLALKEEADDALSWPNYEPDVFLEFAYDNKVCDYLDNYLPHCMLEYQDEIMILYWPPTIKNRNICTKGDAFGTTIDVDLPPEQATVTIPAITFLGEDLHLVSYKFPDNPTASLDPLIPRSVMSGPFTLTYPTVYMAHHDITRVDLKDPEPKSTLVRRSGVIPLRNDDIYTYKPGFLGDTSGGKFARDMAMGKVDFRWPYEEEGKADLRWVTVNFAHFEDPVPADNFFWERKFDCRGTQSHCATITDGSFRPQVRLQDRTWWSLMPQHRECILGILQDPPKAISAISAGPLKEPTLPTRTGALAGQSPDSPIALATATNTLNAEMAMNSPSHGDQGVEPPRNDEVWEKFGPFAGSWVSGDQDLKEKVWKIFHGPESPSNGTSDAASKVLGRNGQGLLNPTSSGGQNSLKPTRTTGGGAKSVSATFNDPPSGSTRDGKHKNDASFMNLPSILVVISHTIFLVLTH